MRHRTVLQRSVPHKHLRHILLAADGVPVAGVPFAQRAPCSVGWRNTLWIGTAVEVPVVNMNPSTSQQIIGTGSAGLAAFIFLLPLQSFLMEWARREVSHDQWVMPALRIVVPLWLLLMVALLCVATSGGFDWLRLGRSAVYALTVGGAVALAAVSFGFIALYIRPGFTPRGLYIPVLYLITLSTVLLVFLNLHPKLLPAIPAQRLLRWWTWFTAFSLVVTVVAAGYWVVSSGVDGVRGLVQRIQNPGPSTAEQLAEIARLDPEADMVSLLWRTGPEVEDAVREAAMARLRAHPLFLDRLAEELENGYVEPAVTFLHSATLTTAEQTRFARPARTAMQRWVDRMPAPNYTTPENFKALKRWGTTMFRVLPEKFAGTGVDFTEVIADFEYKLKGG